MLLGWVYEPLVLFGSCVLGVMALSILRGQLAEKVKRKQEPR